jgi:hypothetical protein
MIKPTSLSVNKEFNYMALSDNSTHQGIYFRGLELSYYNFILHDYSYFQFSLSKEGHETECRLAYYPNPMSDETQGTPNSPTSELKFYEDLFNAGDIDFEQLSQALSEIEIAITSPIVRYDISFSQFNEISHPFAHIHFGINNSSRVAANRVFSPEYFVMFIARTFYFDDWQKKNCELFSLEKEFGLLKSGLDRIPQNKFCIIQDSLLNIV